MSKAELVALVRQIMAGTETEDEQDRLMYLFNANVPHPSGANLIYWPEHRRRDTDIGSYNPTPEEVVELALSYKPIAL